MLQVGVIDNVSSQPYLLAPPPKPIQVWRGTPATVAGLMYAGRLDAALIPVVSLPSINAFAETLGNTGISCCGKVHSVLLLSNTTPRKIIETRRKVFFSRDSLTSHRLLKLLFRMEFNQSPITTIMPGDAAARLLIGDEALIEFSQRNEEQITTDLGEWWYAQTGLPFVFARWICRKSLDAANRKLLLQWIEANLSMSSSPEGQQRLAARFPVRQPAHFTQQYYRDLQLHISPAAEEGQALFEACLRESEQCFLNA